MSYTTSNDIEITTEHIVECLKRATDVGFVYTVSDIHNKGIESLHEQAIDWLKNHGLNKQEKFPIPYANASSSRELSYYLPIFGDRHSSGEQEIDEDEDGNRYIVDEFWDADGKRYFVRAIL